MLECVETATRPAPQFSIIWLHGLGADGHDFQPIVPQLVRPGWPALRFVFPHAPVRAVTINGGARMRAWYDILGFEIAQRQDAKGVRESISQVAELISREIERGVPSERIFLAGFSQGGAIALAAGLREPRRLAGVLALSTYLPLADQLAQERSDANRELPIFMAHGSQDPVVAESLGSMSRDRMRSLGYVIDWHSYPMPHAVCPAEIGDIADWLQKRLTS